MKKSRFTMIELIVVMAIIVMLAGIVMVGAIYARRNARTKRIIAQLSMIRLALTEYESEYGFYPQQPVAGTLSKSMVVSLVNPNGVGYVDLNEEAFSESATGTVITDAFNHPFYYQCPGTMNKKTFDIWSMGVDGKHGNGGGSIVDAQTTSEDTDDINSWTRK